MKRRPRFQAGPERERDIQKKSFKLLRPRGAYQGVNGMIQDIRFLARIWLYHGEIPLEHVFDVGILHVTVVFGSNGTSIVYVHILNGCGGLGNSSAATYESI